MIIRAIYSYVVNVYFYMFVQVFENMYSMSLRYSRTDGDYKESAQKLTNSLGNIR